MTRRSLPSSGRSSRSLVCVLVWLATWVPHVASADRATEIVRDVERRQRTTSRTYTGAIDAIDRQGTVSRKRWQFWVEGPPGESKVLVRLTDPPSLRGLALLVLNHRDKPADQWLYVPAIKRERPIAAQERSASFLGTDFSNEDLQEPIVANYDYELLDEKASVEGRPAYKIKAVMKRREETPDSYLVLWVRKDIVATVQTDFYVGRELRKTLTAGDWEQVQGIWTPLLLEMKGVASGSTTRIRLSDVHYDVRFPADWFTVENLRREP